MYLVMFWYLAMFCVTLDSYTVLHKLQAESVAVQRPE